MQIRWEGHTALKIMHSGHTEIVQMQWSESVLHSSEYVPAFYAADEAFPFGFPWSYVISQVILR